MTEYNIINMDEWAIMQYKMTFKLGFPCNLLFFLLSAHVSIWEAERFTAFVILAQHHLPYNYFHKHDETHTT